MRKKKVENLISANLNFLQVAARRQHGSKMVAGSESQSQSSICSTPGQSSASNKISSDWPDPPDIPAICSTEDEAASLYSDSGECNVTQIAVSKINVKVFNSSFLCVVLKCQIKTFTHR
jgi:hypothetical protein